MVRIATVNDAEQLETLNNEFNGNGETTLENIRESLLNNAQEIVIINDDGGELTGFVCVQMKKSFCYIEYRQITSIAKAMVYHRRRRISSAAGCINLAFALMRYKAYRLNDMPFLRNG